jgi:hypothetical protein
MITPPAPNPLPAETCYGQALATIHHDNLGLHKASIQATIKSFVTTQAVFTPAAISLHPPASPRHAGESRHPRLCFNISGFLEAAEQRIAGAPRRKGR